MSVPPDSSPGSVADDLVAGLAREAELVDEGALTVDVERGLAKLGRYQLSDPYHYVLRLAEAGIRLGADQLWFWTTPTSLVAHFVGEDAPLTLDASTLEGLLTVLIGGSGGDPRRGALVQLAVAANTARQLGPRELWIESIDADGRGHRLQLEGEPRVVAVEAGEPGLWFRAQLGWQLGGRPEARLLRERAAWAWTRIVLDGRWINYGLNIPQSVPMIDEQGYRYGTVYNIPGSGMSPRALLLAYGLVVEQVRLPNTRPGCFAVVEARLERDLSFARFVRDAGFDELVARIEALQPQAIALSPVGSKTYVARRKLSSARLHVFAAASAELLGFVVMFVGLDLLMDGVFALAAMFSFLVGPLWLLFAMLRARDQAEVVPQGGVTLEAEAQRRPALPAIEVPLALPPGQG